MLRAHGIFVLGLGCLAAILSGCGSEAGSGGAPASATAQKTTDFDAPRYAAAPPSSLAAEASAEAAYAVPPATTAASPPPTAAAPLTIQSPLPLAEESIEQSRIEQGRGPGEGGDKHAFIEENEFLAVRDTPLSTFSIDVDTASYAKTRSYLLEHHRLPPPDAVRIEELINYFDYAYAGPTDDHPFAVDLETVECPWQPQHRLLRIGIQGKRADQQRPVSNLVFLIDVSGSMDQPNKLPLVQRSLALLVRQLGENDKVSIVVYAGAAGLVLPPTSGASQSTILAAIENLRAGGSTNGGQGIQLAYATARQQFNKHGTNRVLLCTDGDFNVGVTSTGELIRLATEEAKAGIYLSILGYGFGNHNDALLEELSNKANGNYAFIDSDSEARKVLVEQMQGTLVTIAKDVKLQVEFNPATVAAYRLIGYENRRLADRDFNDDTKDAGDIGAGHSVTALYELVPAGADSPLAQPAVDPLKYQKSGNKDQESREKSADKSGELLTLKLRYQPPAGGKSTLMTFPLTDSGSRFGSASSDLQFAASVASFGMLLRNSKHKGQASYAAVLEIAAASQGEDRHGLRGEFLELVKAAQRHAGEPVGAAPLFPIERPAAVVGAPRVIPQPVARCGVVDPPPTSLYLVHLRNWWHGLRSDEAFAVGIGAGVAASLLALASCVALVKWQLHCAAMPAMTKPVPTKGSQG
jgi:Ca-activated chloride channel family protein